MTGLAKAVLLRGSPHPFDILGGTGGQGLVVDDTGRIDTTAGFADYLGDATLPERLSAPRLVSPVSSRSFPARTWPS